MALKELCAVTGASGSVGPALVRQLLAAGYCVRAFARRRPMAGVLPPEAEVHIGDISDQASVCRLTHGAKYVFHLAAKLDEAVIPSRPTENCVHVNVEGTRTVLYACQQSGVQRLIYFSTVNVYGGAPSETLGALPTLQRDVIDEDTAPRPAGDYAKSKWQAEELILNAPRVAGSQTSATVLRFTSIYGPRMKGNYVVLVKRLRNRSFIPVGDGTNRRTLIHEEDAARAARLAAECPRAAGRIYNISDGHIYSASEVLLAVCMALGRNPPRTYLPFPAAIAIARLGDGLLGLCGGSPRYASRVIKFVEDKPVRAARIRNELGFEPDFDLYSGWSRTIASWALEGRTVRHALASFS